MLCCDIQVQVQVREVQVQVQVQGSRLKAQGSRLSMSRSPLASSLVRVNGLFTRLEHGLLVRFRSTSRSVGFSAHIEALFVHSGLTASRLYSLSEHLLPQGRGLASGLVLRGAGECRRLAGATFGALGSYFAFPDSVFASCIQPPFILAQARGGRTGWHCEARARWVRVWLQWCLLAWRTQRRGREMVMAKRSASLPLATAAAAMPVADAATVRVVLQRLEEADCRRALVPRQSCRRCASVRDVAARSFVERRAMVDT
jgi:hypothetical protein